MKKGPSDNLPPITSNTSQLHCISNKDAPASATDNPIAPDVLPFAEIAEHRFSIISAAIKNVYGITMAVGLSNRSNQLLCHKRQ